MYGIRKKIKRSVLLIFLIIALVSVSKTVNSQLNFDDENRQVFWFYVKLEHIKGSSNHYHYNIKKKEKIYNGSIIEFDRNLWKFMYNGKKIAIGPFNSENDASQANSIYKTELKLSTSDSTLFNKEFYWTEWKIVKNPKPGHSRFDAIWISTPIGSGNCKEFQKILSEKLLKKIILIGPYQNIKDVENVKERYMLH